MRCLTGFLKAAREADSSPSLPTQLLMSLAGTHLQTPIEDFARDPGCSSLGWRRHLASISRWAEHEQDKTNAMFRAWLDEHEGRFRELESVTGSIAAQVVRPVPLLRRD